MYIKLSLSNSVLWNKINVVINFKLFTNRHSNKMLYIKLIYENTIFRNMKIPHITQRIIHSLYSTFPRVSCNFRLNYT